MHDLPRRCAVYLGVIAFLITWAVGLANQVPPYNIVLRALLAATVFGGLGYVLGRVALNGIIDAIGRHLRQQEEANRPPAGSNKK